MFAVSINRACNRNKMNELGRIEYRLRNFCYL